MSDAGIDRSPDRTGVLLTAAAALGAVASLAVAGVPSALALGVVGVVVLLGAAAVGHRRGLDWGALVAFGGVLLAGIGGARAGPLLVSMVATVVAWDAGEQAISVGEQLGRAAPTRRATVVHVAASTLVGAGGAAVGYGVYRLAGGGRPASALALLLLGGVLITWALRE